jgi:hypothetical protein
VALFALDHYQGPTSIDTYRTVKEPVTLCTQFQTTTRCIGSVTADIEHWHAASMLLRLLLRLLLLRLQFG